MNKRSWARRGAGLLAAAALVGGLGFGGTAQAASGPHQVGDLYQGMSNVPSSVQRGSAVFLRLYYKAWSPGYRMQVQQVALHALDWTTGTTTGVKVDWLDPATNRWQADTQVQGDWHMMRLPVAPVVAYASSTWHYVYVRLLFSSSARLGQWTLMTNAPEEYQMWTVGGQMASGWLGQPISAPARQLVLHG